MLSRVAAQTDFQKEDSMCPRAANTTALQCSGQNELFSPWSVQGMGIEKLLRWMDFQIKNSKYTYTLCEPSQHYLNSSVSVMLSDKRCFRLSFHTLCETKETIQSGLLMRSYISVLRRNQLPACNCCHHRTHTHTHLLNRLHRWIFSVIIWLLMSVLIISPWLASSGLIVCSRMRLTHLTSQSMYIRNRHTQFIWTNIKVTVDSLLCVYVLLCYL